MASVIAHYRAMSHQRLVCFQVQQRGEPEASEQVNHLTRNSSSSSSRDKGSNSSSSRLRSVAKANPRSYRRVPRGTVAVAPVERRVGREAGAAAAAVVVVAWLAEAVRTQRRPLVRAPTVPSSSSSFPPRTLRQRRPVGQRTRTRGVTCSADNEALRTEGQCRRGLVERCLTWSRSCSHEDMDLRAGIASTISIACSTTARRTRERRPCSTCPSFHRSRTREAARVTRRYRSRTRCSRPGVNRMSVW